MSALMQTAQRARYTVAMPRSDDFDFWREQARILVQCNVSPDHVSWTEPGGTQDLFADTGAALPEPPDAGKFVRAPKRFLALARNAALHSEPERFALLYNLLWRLQTKPGIMQDKADTDVRRLEELDKNVRRDSHKMHAFVRFREVREGAENGSNGEPHYVAWFEPDHHILRANAGFFKRRFANMRWSILTPRGSLYWDGETMREGRPAQRSDAPDGDPIEDLWRTYYASIFNPARLKVSAMMSEMPKKYWKNMPEAALIPELIASAQSREAQMVSAGEREVRERPTSLAEITRGISACRDCAIADCGTRAVMGEGPSGAQLMIIGEQPGDQEDLAGRVFVGPAGQVLNAQLDSAGIDRSQAYVTNAVKHFKFVEKGKRRLHQNPTAKEIDTCRWWVEAERAIVRPKLVLALGASAARSLLGKTVSVKQVRGAPMTLEDGSELWVTVHPSYLLRLDGAARAEQEALFAADLVAVKSRLVELA